MQTALYIFVWSVSPQEVFTSFPTRSVMLMHKPWFDEGCAKLLEQRKHAKLQWLQDPREINGDNLNT
jgi:hypothetical protein